MVPIELREEGTGRNIWHELSHGVEDQSLLPLVVSAVARRFAPSCLHVGCDLL